MDIVLNNKMQTIVIPDDAKRFNLLHAEAQNKLTGNIMVKITRKSNLTPEDIKAGVPEPNEIQSFECEPASDSFNMNVGHIMQSLNLHNARKLECSFHDSLQVNNFITLEFDWSD